MGEGDLLADVMEVGRPVSRRRGPAGAADAVCSRPSDSPARRRPHTRERGARSPPGGGVAAALARTPPTRSGGVVAGAKRSPTRPRGERPEVMSERTATSRIGPLAPPPGADGRRSTSSGPGPGAADRRHAEWAPTVSPRRRRTRPAGATAQSEPESESESASSMTTSYAPSPPQSRPQDELDGHRAGPVAPACPADLHRGWARLRRRNAENVAVCRSTCALSWGFVRHRSFAAGRGG
jgi:hypothetical protein